MKVFTIATQGGRTFPALLESVSRHGVDLDVMGWGDAWRGLGQKLRAMAEYLDGVDPAETVLYVDAHDCVFVKPIEVPPVQGCIMAAETNCYPVAEWAEAYPSCATPYRFLNSGCWVANAGYMSDLLERMQARRLPANGNDQRYFSEWFLRRGGIEIDTHCAFFMCLFGATGDLELEGRAFNRVTQTCPTVLHGNGRSDMTPILRWAKLPEGEF